LQLVKKFPAFHGTRRFITALTSVRHLSLSWANPIQSTDPYPTSWRSIVILSTHLRLGLPSCLFPSGFLPRHEAPKSARKSYEIELYYFSSVFFKGCCFFYLTIQNSSKNVRISMQILYDIPALDFSILFISITFSTDLEKTITEKSMRS